MNKRIKEIRETLKLSKEEFANKIGITTTELEEIEIGNKKVEEESELQLMICKSYGIDYLWLRTGENEMFFKKEKEDILQLILDVSTDLLNKDKETDSLSINERVKKIREFFNMNQTEFGEKLGVSRDVISNIELNRVEVKPLMIKLLCRTFNIDYIWLTRGAGEMFFVNDESEDYSLQFNDICKEVFNDFGSYSSLRAKELTKKFYNIEFSNNAKLVEEGMRLGETMLIEAVKDIKEGKSSEEVYKKYGHRIAEEAAMLCDNVGI